jgi:hypothetical protein
MPKDVWHAEIDPFVTQSWLNWTKPGQWHHKHSHPNSLYSGVLYLDVEMTGIGFTSTKMATSK